MKNIIFIVGMLVLLLMCLSQNSVVYACDYCIDHPGEREIQYNGVGANNGTHQLQKDHLVLVRRINELNKTIDTMYSMLADLEIKFMGNERYQQICNPDNIPETERQKIYSDKMIEVINTKHGGIDENQR